MWPRMRILRSVSSHVSLIWAIRRRVVLCSKPFPQIKRVEWGVGGSEPSLFSGPQGRQNSALSPIREVIWPMILALFLHTLNTGESKVSEGLRCPPPPGTLREKGQGQWSLGLLTWRKAVSFILKSAAVRWAIHFEEGCMGFLFRWRSLLTTGGPQANPESRAHPHTCCRTSLQVITRG